MTTGMVLGLTLGMVGPTSAAPTDTGPDPGALASWPAELRQLIAGTTDFRSAPWFTDTSCSGSAGGNVGMYMNAYFANERAFRDTVWQAVDPEGFAAFNAVATDLGEEQVLDVFPNGNTAYDMAVDVCAADLERWNGTGQQGQQGFSFTWAAAPDQDSLVKLSRLQAVATLPPMNPDKVDENGERVYTVNDLELGTAFTEAKGANGRWPDFTTICELGAPYCDRQTWANCGSAADETDQQRCVNWNMRVALHLVGMTNWVESNKDLSDRLTEFVSWVGGGLYNAGAWVLNALGWVAGRLKAAVGWLVKKGMEQVVAFFTDGFVWLWSLFASWIVNYTTPNLLAGGFQSVYGLVAGVMLMMSFLLWLAGLVVAYRRGAMRRSLLGGIKAIFAIQYIGGFAFLMVGLAREATHVLIDGFEETINSSDFSAAMLAAHPVVGMLAALLGCVCVVAALLLLIFQVPMVFAHTMFGTIAAAGQAHPATEAWLRNWFFKFLALAWTPFFMVALIIMGLGLSSAVDSNTQQNFGQQFVTLLAGMLMLVGLPLMPKILSSVMHAATGVALGAAESFGAGVGQSAAKVAAGAVALPAIGAAAKAGLDAAAGTTRGAVGTTMSAVASMGDNLRKLGSWDQGQQWQDSRNPETDADVPRKTDPHRPLATDLPSGGSSSSILVNAVPLGQVSNGPAAAASDRWVSTPEDVRDSKTVGGRTGNAAELQAAGLVRPAGRGGTTRGRDGGLDNSGRPVSAPHGTDFNAGDVTSTVNEATTDHVAVAGVLAPPPATQETKEPGPTFTGSATISARAGAGGSERKSYQSPGPGPVVFPTSDNEGPSRGSGARADSPAWSTWWPEPTTSWPAASSGRTESPGAELVDHPRLEQPVSNSRQRVDKLPFA